MKRSLLLLILLLPVSLSSQLVRVLEEAPEKWSMPKKVVELSPGSNANSNYPSLTGDQSKIVFYLYSDTAHERFYYALNTDSGFSTPQPIKGFAHRPLIRQPCITYDGKTLFFSDWTSDGYGSWDLYQCNWDSAKNEFGPPVNMGPNVNDQYSNKTCMTPDGRILIQLLGFGIRYSLWSDSLQDWTRYQALDKWNLLTAYDRAWLLPNRKKIYYDGRVNLLTWQDIYVNYYDSVAGNWGRAMTLNLNLMMDTLRPEMTDLQKYQTSPWLSPDGKTMYFTSWHDGHWGIYMSVMLIDENGNPVTHVDETGQQVIPGTFRLLQNYPNPFNPTTVIWYELSRESPVRIHIVNALGQTVRTIDEGFKQQGKYHLVWDGKSEGGASVASGIYYCRLLTPTDSKAIKMVLMR